MDIVSSAEELFRFDMQEETGFLQFLGTQFYRGEPIQLWMEILDEEGNPLSVQGFPTTHLTPGDSGVMDTVTANIYMYKADGSRELLVEGLPKNDPHEPLFTGFSSIENAFSANRMMDYCDSGWYADENGGCYCSLLYTIDAEVLGGNKEPDIETLVSALLAWEEGGALYAFDSPEIILRWFLQGSDDLFGMLDWEQGSCDLSGGLLEKLLEVSKKYGYDERYNHHNLMRSTRLADICQYDSAAELADQGRVVCGVLFEDRCRGTVTSEGTLAINSSSKASRGAWEFLRFLLSDDAQSKTSSFPIKRSLLKDWTAQQAARAEADENGITINVSYIDRGELVKDQKTYTAADMTEARTEEYLDALENIRAFPIRCVPVLDIICQEAEDYFNGNKSIEEVINVIENRIGLYLAERH